MALDEFIERRILTGLIISTEYVRRVRPFWKDELLESPEIRRVSSWCIDYFDKYDQAPDQHIEDIYFDRAKTENISKAEGEFIERMLQRLSDEYGRGEQFNSAYLYDQTTRYLRQQELRQYNEQLDELTEKGLLEEATEFQREWRPSSFATTKGLELNSEQALIRLRQAFSEPAQSVLRYPGALGEMLNEHLIRGGFVSFVGPEKRGKTWILMDAGLRAIRQKSNVAFFQAGDMTEDQQLRRICIYLAKRSDKERYCKKHWRPVGDCIFNQLDLCTRSDRNCDHGIYEDVTLEDYYKERKRYESKSMLVDMAKEHKNYEPCDSVICNERKGTVWFVEEPEKEPLSVSMAERELLEFFKKYKRRFKLATYPSGTLSISEINSCLDEWERADDFVPDVVIVDYADLMFARAESHRHQQDAIWKGLRGISQERHSLMMTATQSDADSYTKNRISLINFSEDKRKHAHVTAMWGLNQDPAGREKQLGIIRINELLAREGEFSSDTEIKVLQDLWMGRPILESYK